ncbi:LysR family transcriptional regulator [Chelatococcus sp. SYSU_G07232]|uniref:LysR family transcriptional regulator n=1 Tax=Chelatococcus albus TaxID=3047466 RepID=A0ABT7AKT3_9HYPH|nr:LysR family transcriptional regulator [Chelatococcus sp. SYSU_G07232]MDJ1159991.1 LysR family transcriptional regulator [Chelatococcus sp. SYSU_G07232]
MQQSALRYFLEVARTGSVSAAAERLRVAASAVSRQISKLEEELGAPLFERRARGMVPTHAGRLLASHAERAALESEQIVNEIRELSAAGRGLVRLGVTEGMAVSFIPEMIHAYRIAHPRVLFDLKVLPPAQVTTCVREGEVDIGITFSLSADAGVKVQWQRAVPAHAFAAPNHPLMRRERVTMAEVLAYPTASLDGAATIRRMLDHYCAAQGMELEPAINSTNVTSVIHFCRLGGAVMFSAYVSVLAAVRDGHLAAVPLVEGGILERSLQVQTMLGRRLPAATQGFLDLVIAELEALGPPPPARA